MKPFVAIIGSEKSGKSTLIRSLTGCRTRSFCGVVTDLVSNQKIYVIASSPQEQDLSSDELDRILNQVWDDASILGIVMAIQPTRPIKHLSMEDIFQKVQATRAFSTFGVIIHPSYNASPAIDPDDVRRRLEALEVEFRTIDGRHFAHLNACEVRELAGLP